MFDNIRLIEVLRSGGFVAGSIEATGEPGVRDVSITDATCKNDKDVVIKAARVLANAGYDILCYGRTSGNSGAIASLTVMLPTASRKAV